MCQPKGFSQKPAAGQMVQENTLKPALISNIGLASKPVIHRTDYQEKGGKKCQFCFDSKGKQQALLCCFSSPLSGLLFLKTHPACLSMGCGYMLACSVSSTSPWRGKAKKQQSKAKIRNSCGTALSRCRPNEQPEPTPLGVFSLM